MHLDHTELVLERASLGIEQLYTKNRQLVVGTDWLAIVRGVPRLETIDPLRVGRRFRQ